MTTVKAPIAWPNGKVYLFERDGTSNSSGFDRKILRDWGNRPTVPGSPLRLDPAADSLAHSLFLTAWRFGGFECENNGIGPSNKWPGKGIGDVGGFVIHPDYVDVPPPGQQLRAAHQNHIHMQIGPTR